MNAASVLSSLYFSSSASVEASEQQQPVSEPSPVSKPKQNSTVTVLSTPSTIDTKSSSVCGTSSYPPEAPVSSTILNNEGYSTPKTKLEENQTQIQQMPSPSPMSSKGKRKRLDMDNEVTSFVFPTPTKRKAGSNDFLRKGQWTSTEERLARLLIEAFEDGYLPIYTGIRLRGYLAVQLQCDPMRVSKKLCAGTIDGKPVPKNYGQKKFKLRKKALWDPDEAASRITELERMTKAMWTEARLKKPSYLTLSSTRTLNKRKEPEGDDDIEPSPPSPAKGRSSSTPKTKKQKVFPIIYLNLSKFKRYSGGGSCDVDPASPSTNSDSDSEPVRLDGESLQAAYDLLTLCSPRGSSSKSKSRKGKTKKVVKRVAPHSEEEKSDDNPPMKEKLNEGVVAQDKSSVEACTEDSSFESKPVEEAFVAETSIEKEPAMVDTTLESVHIEKSPQHGDPTTVTVVNSSQDVSITNDPSI